MKFIRWKAIIPTVIILVLLSIFSIFCLDGIIKKTIIKTGESVFGARVDIVSVKTKFKDMSVKIHGLQVADKNDVWKNILEIEKIGFAVSPLQLLSKKLIIDEMITEGIRWGTKRETSGALPPGKKKKLEKKQKEEEEKDKDSATSKIMASLKKKAAAEANNLTAISNIKEVQKQVADFDVKKAVDSDNLASLKEINSMKSELAEKEKKYKAMADQIDVNAKSKEITEALNSVKDLKIKSPADIVTAKEKISKLKETQESAKQMLDQIKTAKNSIAADFGGQEDFINRINKLKTADYDNIMSKLPIGNFKTGNITKTLIGPACLNRVNSIIRYIKLARKYTPKSKKKKVVKKRQKGMDVVFEKEKEMPDFLIRKIVISGTTGGNGKDNKKSFDFSGNVFDITSNPLLWGRPTIARISGKQKRQVIKMDLEFDHTKEIPRDEMSILLTGMTPKALGMGNMGDVLIVDDGEVKIDTEFVMVGDDINSKIDVNITKVKMGTFEKENETQKIFRQMMKNIKAIIIGIKLASRKDDFDFKVNSNLDDILKDGMKSLVGEKMTELKAKIRSEIDKQVAEKQKELLGNLTGKKAELLKNLTSKEQTVSSKKAELQSKIDSFQDEIKNQGKEKVKEEIKDKLKGLFGK
ncbi:MAG: TIGR03545 family protein [Elusimicrobia bacterium]|nr:TIGR03545 family protein [Elusimicrobiota bacterium]